MCYGRRSLVLHGVGEEYGLCVHTEVRWGVDGLEKIYPCMMFLNKQSDFAFFFFFSNLSMIGSRGRQAIL
jgi:hypothetical protein